MSMSVGIQRAGLVDDPALKGGYGDLLAPCRLQRSEGQQHHTESNTTQMQTQNGEDRHGGSSTALRRRAREVDFGSAHEFLFAFHPIVSLNAVTKDLGGDKGGELADIYVVFLYRLDIATPLRGYAVLGSFKLGHEVAEKRVGLELRIVLGHSQQAGKRRT